jgi:lysophospholipid acyltransferase (LPLAT)-like uncharacterized protein
MSRARTLSAIGAALARLLFLTIRLRLIDRPGFTSNPPDFPVIITFWHNRILAITLTHLRHYPAGRKGVSVLTSASRDGDLLAASMARFKMGAIRGSSSRRGSRAIRECVRHLEGGADLAVTPDGPRGPRYRLGPGLILLAQATNARILPMQAKFSHCIQLKSWDRFCIPLPFSRIDVTVSPYETIPPTTTDEEFETQRLRIESILNNEID